MGCTCPTSTPPLTIPRTCEGWTCPAGTRLRPHPRNIWCPPTGCSECCMEDYGVGPVSMYSAEEDASVQNAVDESAARNVPTPARTLTLPLTLGFLVFVLMAKVYKRCRIGQLLRQPRALVS